MTRVILALLLLACRCAPGPSEVALQPEDIGHYAVMTEVVDALRTGELAAVKDLSRQLEGGAAVDDPALAVHADRLHGAIGFAIAATDLEDASHAVAVMGSACRDCHEAASSPLTVSPPPRSASGIDAHAVGASAVWLGYIAADRSVYLAGLARYPDGLDSEDAQTLASRMADVATTTPTIGTPDTMGELLLTCSGCH